MDNWRREKGKEGKSKVGRIGAKGGLLKSKGNLFVKVSIFFFFVIPGEIASSCLKFLFLISLRWGSVIRQILKEREGEGERERERER